MTRTRSLIVATMLTLGTAAVAASASASGVDAFRYRHHGLHHSAHSVRLAGPGRLSCLVRQVKPDGTVVYIDRCAPESAASRPAIAQAQ
ncbi:MAG: hypothetical protein JO000_17700 [Alphaproteobacteria bacterium]|nr:hypothetical protein [Alphaproteobacteria bacterium]